MRINNTKSISCATSRSEVDNKGVRSVGEEQNILHIENFDLDVNREVERSIAQLYICAQKASIWIDFELVTAGWHDLRVVTAVEKLVLVLHLHVRV